jgi:hypothetical protein
MNFRKIVAMIMLVAIQISGCTGYKSQYVSFRPPEAYSNKQEVAGVMLGGEAYSERAEATDAFGFDIREAGLLPVQIVMSNQNGNTLQIVTDQTFLVDAKGNYWQVVSNHAAITRIEKSTQLAALGKGAGTGALIGAAGGAILGAALGIASGRNVGNVMGRGAALGAAGGAIIGSTNEASSGDRRMDILNDIRDKGLEGKTIPREYLANGFLFFPGEAQTAKALRLQFKELETGNVHVATINF